MTPSPEQATLARELAPRLQQRGAELRQLLRDSAEHVPDDLSEVLDFKDVAAEEALAAVEEVTQSHAARELAQVAAALRRIQAGTYGFCAACGDAIDARRLRALPATPFCTDCQADRERAGGDVS